MCCNKGVKKERAFDRLKTHNTGFISQGVDNQLLVNVVNTWIKWAK